MRLVPRRRGDRRACIVGISASSLVANGQKQNAAGSSEVRAVITTLLHAEARAVLSRPLMLQNDPNIARGIDNVVVEYLRVTSGESVALIVYFADELRSAFDSALSRASAVTRTIDLSSSSATHHGRWSCSSAGTATASTAATVRG